jgi:hypothetical protein
VKKRKKNGNGKIDKKEENKEMHSQESKLTYLLTELSPS